MLILNTNSSRRIFTVTSKQIELTENNLKAVHSSLEILGDTAIVAQTDKDDIPDENTYARVLDVDFDNGVIEVDVKGSIMDGAFAAARGFVGIAFGINDNDSEFECFYIRPTNGRDCIDPVRKSHACQYFTYPGYIFSYYREFGIEGYEAAVDTIAIDEWAHLKIEVTGDKAKFFVNGELVLSSDKLKHGDTHGAVGLWTGCGARGFFKNLCITEY